MTAPVGREVKTNFSCLGSVLRVLAPVQADEAAGEERADGFAALAGAHPVGREGGRDVHGRLTNLSGLALDGPSAAGQRVVLCPTCHGRSRVDGCSAGGRAQQITCT